MFNPTRLDLARRRRGLNKSEFAKAVGISVRTVSDYEKGRYPPTADTLARIALALNFPIEWFSGPTIPCPSTATASFRSLARLTVGKQEAALAAGAIAYLLDAWLHERFVLPPVVLPDLRHVDPETAAASIRHEWGLGEHPVKNMVHLLESKGVRVFSLAEDTADVDAFSCWHNETPYIFLNTKKSGERSRFDAAHELGHLTLHRYLELHHRGADHKSIEKEAHLFAGAFLMPKSGIVSHVPSLPSLASLIQLKKHWLVSVAALTHRVNQLGLLSEYHYRALSIEISQRGYRSNEPEPMMREMSLIFPQLFRALKNEGLGRTRLAAELQVSVDEIDKLVFGLSLTAIDGGASRPERSTCRDTIHLVNACE